MRKILIGVFIGFALSFAVSAHAEIVNIIGKTVDGQFPVKINGQTIDNQAAVIEGTSYLPVRAIGDALNMDVSFNADLGIELKAKGGSALTTTPRRQTIFPENPPVTPDDSLLQQLSELSSKYDKIHFDQFQIASKMSVYENTGKEKDQQYNDWKKQVDEYARQLKDLEIQIQQLKQRLNK